MLSITHITLFKHGVALFERRGHVEGEALIELSFKAQQMNDVLKSLTALDFDGGRFTSLSYDSEEPIQRRLAAINIRIPDNGAFSSFVGGLKGAAISLRRGDEDIKGVIVGLEQIQRASEAGVVTEPHLSVLCQSARLVRVSLLEVSELEFDDEKLKRDLSLLLDTLFSSVQTDRKRMSIKAVGEGRRELSLSYVLEAPLWKASYRLVLAQDDSAQPLLQGWALIDNTTDDDWSDVKISLVSGLPISFVHDLYSPRYRKRAVVVVDEEAGVAPPVLESGSRVRPAPPPAPMPSDPFASADLEMAVAAPVASKSKLSRTRALNNSVEVSTRTQEVGDLFCYEIEERVDVQRGRSALVPILHASIEAQSVLHYNRDVREKNPMTAFKLNNTSGLTLEGGPITVFEGSAYVGEAMLDTVRAGEERLTPYSVELGVSVKQDSSRHTEDVTRISKQGQFIYKHFRTLQVSVYQFDSRLDTARTVYLDHRFTYPQWLDGDEPVEVTEHYWRYRFDLPAREVFQFVVSEVAQNAEAIDLPAIAHYEIRALSEKKLIGLEVAASLSVIADKAQALAQGREQRATLEEQLEGIGQGQARLRDNLKVLGSSVEESRLRQTYVNKLELQEQELEALTQAISDQTHENEAMKASLDTLVESLDLKATSAGT